MFWEGFYCFFCREDYNVITTFTEFHRRYLFIKNYLFCQLLNYYVLHGLVYSFLSIWDFKNKWEMLNVSFHPSEIGNQLDLLYIHFKRGARHELTQVAHKRQVSSILPDALVRDLRSRIGRETMIIKEHYETGFVCALANVHYKLISN